MAELDLIVGPNTLTVTVTAQDGTTTQPYTITVTRAAAACTDVWCATLTVQSLSDGAFRLRDQPVWQGVLRPSHGGRVHP